LPRRLCEAAGGWGWRFEFSCWKRSPRGKPAWPRPRRIITVIASACARFRDAGAEALSDYELLELLLFRVMPRRDVKPLAKAPVANSVRSRKRSPRRRRGLPRSKGSAKPASPS
jgi:hypothetical protein